MIESQQYRILIKLEDLHFGFINKDLEVGLKLVFIMDLNRIVEDQNFIWMMVKDVTVVANMIYLYG